MSETTSSDEKLNWSIRLEPADADGWDDLHRALRRETGRRTLSKAEVFRALIALTADPAAHSRLVGILTAEQ